MAGKRRKDVHVGGLQLPMFETPSEWTLPTELPDLSRAKYVGVDVEARDPNLRKLGPGYLRRDAEVVGVSLATDYGFKTYLPFGHGSGEQLDKARVVEYVQAQLSRPEQVKVGANLMYEFEALDSLGIKIRGPTYDIQIAEPLLDEERPGGFGLEALAKSYEGVGKSERLLEEAADNWGLDKKRQLWMLDPRYTGEYAEDDALLPIRIMEKQLVRLSAERLDRVWQLECDLLPVLWKMRKHGVRVDLDRATELGKEIEVDENRLLRSIWDEVEFRVDPWNSRSLYELFERLGIEHMVGYTKPTKNFPNGQPSFTNDFFKVVAEQHPVCKKLLDYRNMSKMRRDFVEGVVIGKNVDGRLHPQWHPLRQEDEDEDQEGGTRTGRVASSKPNLMQIPARHPVWGKKVRSCFVADEGGRWCKNDFSAQEPRVLLHFAYLKGYPGAAEARQRYLDNPYTDYHQMTADLIRAKTGQDIGRGRAKTINLGSAYGMGFYKLARGLGVDDDTAKDILKAYHDGVPFVKKLEERCIEVIHGQGFIRTVLGRKRRFDSWEAEDWKRRSKPIRSREDAVELFGRVVRAFAHKGLNAMVQGSSADQNKVAMVLLDREGLTPQLTVHDELDQTVYSDAQAWRIKHIMETAIPEFTVPHVADPEVGRSWGDVEALTAA